MSKDTPEAPLNPNARPAPLADFTIPHGPIDPEVAYLVRQRFRDGLGRNHIIALCYRPDNNNYVWISYTRDGPNPIHKTIDMGAGFKMERLFVSFCGNDMLISATTKVPNVNYPPGIPGDYDLLGVWAPTSGSPVGIVQWPTLPDVPTFIDVPKLNADGTANPFFEGIETQVALGAISGYDNPDGTRSFRPNNNLTRAQYAKATTASEKRLLAGAQAQAAGRK